MPKRAVGRPPSWLRVLSIAALVTSPGIPTDAWRAVTELGGLARVAVGLGLVLWLAWRRRPVEAVVVAVALVGASLFTDAAKDLIARPRPPGPHLDAAIGYSFPSGHALNSTATYGLVVLGACRSSLAPTARRVAAAVLVAIPFLVGLSRVALGVHYPSDVLGGWLAGTAAVFIVATITRPPTRSPREDARSGP